MSKPKSAIEDTLSAAARYFSSNSGESESTSPMLSKPLPTSSEGKSSAGRAWMSSRSRIVLLYSARLSRRSRHVPGIVHAAAVEAKDGLIDPLDELRRFGGVGRGSWSAGGIEPAPSIFARRSQVFRSPTAVEKSFSASKFTSPSCVSRP